MKFSFALIAFAWGGSREANAFSVSSSLRRASFLKMNVETRETQNIKVGVIGAGRIGLVHLEAITKAPGVTPIIISNPTVSKAAAGKFVACRETGQ